MRIGVAQITCDLGDVSKNISRISYWIDEAKRAGCETVVLPEMVDTGYEMSVIREKACPWSGEPFHSVQRFALANHLNVVCGLSEREGDKVFNSMVVMSASGKLIGKYRKTHLAAFSPVCEDSVVSPGDSLEVIELGGFKFGLMICYDLRFPEVSRSLALKGADVLVLCSAWAYPRDNHWRIFSASRAIENQAYLIAANRVGTDGAAAFCGGSCIIDPFGVVVSVAGETGETLLVSEISKDRLATVRKQIPVFQHRRKDLYFKSC